MDSVGMLLAATRRRRDNFPYIGGGVEQSVDSEIDSK